jgi:hypothetical protein
MIALTGAGCALLVDLLVVWPVLSGSLSTLLLMGLAVYATVVLLASTAKLVWGLRRVHIGLAATPRSLDEWVRLFAGTGIERLAHRLLDPAPPDDRGYPRTLLLQSRTDPSQARHELTSLLRDCLSRAQFFTAIAFLIAISGCSALQAYSPAPLFTGVPPLPLAIGILIVVLIIAVLCVLVVQSATEPFLDALMQMPTERLETRLVRRLTELAERANNPLPISHTVPAVSAQEPALERLGILLEEMIRSLQNSANRLGTTADLIAGAMRALPERERGAARPRDEHAMQQLIAAVEELRHAIELLPGIAEGKAARGAAQAADAKTQATPDTDLGREVRDLLKEFE